MGVMSFLKSREEKFWSWFQNKEDAIFNFENNMDEIFDQLSAELSKVNEDLTFEFGAKRENGTREFVISADGIKSAFPAVENLAKYAPKLDRWVITKFRPRRYPINDLTYGDKEIKAENVSFRVFKDKDPNKLGVMLFFDDYKEDEHNVWGSIGYLFLDEALGEYDVETKVGAITFESKKSEYFIDARPIGELATEFDRYFKG